MIAPASPADWLQGLTMTALLAGVGITFSWMLGLEEPALEVGGDLDAPRASVPVGAVDA
jgi:hypothetical protein